ncbi:protein gamma response 1-like [Cornus florida]|uniref:protein gamma response 1-like n=1 Tax=Cornus florida TaxID=4283 RepID=UPI0028A1DED4|nr:protein gamma response 1-like [Cornus florida]
MEGDLQRSPQPGYPVDSGDAKYVSGLSTILVATIQETKDRISQIEYIFCSQLFPNFQSKSRSLQNIYSEAKKAAEDVWKEKEKELLLQIEKLQLEKQQALEENHYLKKEKAKFVNFEGQSPNSVNKLQVELKQMTEELGEGRELQHSILRLLEIKDTVICDMEKMLKEHEQKYDTFVKKERSLQLEAEELRCELMKKSKELDKVKELKDNLLKQIESQALKMVNYEQLLSDCENKKKLLTAKLETAGNTDGLQRALLKKIDEVEEGRKLQDNLLKKLESLASASKMVNYEQLLRDCENKKKLFTAKPESSVDVVGLQNALLKKIEEVEEGRKLQEELLRQIDLKGSEMLRTRQQLEELGKEKILLLARLKNSEEKIDNLQVELREKSNESSDRMSLRGKLLQQIKVKDSELMSEKKKKRDVIAAYKSLKSQYNFLCKKFGLTTENMLPNNRMGDESDSSRQCQNPLTSPDIENRTLDVSAVACEMTKQKIDRDKMEDHKGVGLTQGLSSDPPASTSFLISPKRPTNGRSGPLAGSKRPVSYWRETRSHQNRGGPDPHDDFLDTPLENIRGNLKRALKGEAHDLLSPVPKDMNSNSSDDETQDINVDPGPQKPQMPVPRPGTRTFKYVESVRKKAERESLKGIECKDCKKFYDAVLDNDGGKGTDGMKQNLRCEHHDGVSRHRYRYAPPLTPEGFWNIGFESEM